MTPLSGQLEQVKSLHDAGYLTDDEYEVERRRLLSSALADPPVQRVVPRTAIPALPAAVPAAVVAPETRRRSNAKAFIFIAASVVLGTIWALNSPSTAPVAGGETACEAAFRDASDGSIGGGELYDLDPAMRACGSLRDWEAAWSEYPPNAGNDPRFVAENRCLAGGFDSTRICKELGLP